MERRTFIKRMGMVLGGLGVLPAVLGFKRPIDKLPPADELIEKSAEELYYTGMVDDQDDTFYCEMSATADEKDWHTTCQQGDKFIRVRYGKRTICTEPVQFVEDHNENF